MINIDVTPTYFFLYAKDHYSLDDEASVALYSVTDLCDFLDNSEEEVFYHPCDLTKNDLLRIRREPDGSMTIWIYCLPYIAVVDLSKSEVADFANRLRSERR